MKSLRDLERAIQDAPDTRSEATARAALAYELARAGYLPAARAQLDVTRQLDVVSLGDGVALRTMLAESVCAYFGRNFPLAIDRANRSYRLSMVLQERDLTALSAAWLAHFAFNAKRYELSRDALLSAIKAVTPGNPDAAIRVCTTVGDMALASQLFDAGARWYGIARVLAGQAQDHSWIEAVLHNKSTLLLSQLRLRCMVSGRSLRKGDVQEAELDSAYNYCLMLGIKETFSPYQAWSFRIRMLEGDYSRAAELGRPLLGLVSGLAPEDGVPILGDLAFCFSRTGDVSSARKVIGSIPDGSYEALYEDDQVVMALELSEIYRVFGEESRAGSFSLIAKARTKALADMDSALRAIVGEAEDAAKGVPSMNWPDGLGVPVHQ